MVPHYDTAMMEGLSRAYVRAVAVRAGCTYTDKWERDIGTDALIDYVDWIDGKPRETGIHLRLQIKSTSQGSKHTSTDVIHDVEVEHYRKLIQPSPGVRIVLIVFDMPGDIGRWLDTAPDSLVLRNCAYWICLEGNDDVRNRTTVRVKLSRAQPFDVKAVQGPLREIASRADPVSEARRAYQSKRTTRSLPTVGRRPAP
jgi:Domain of unknown function (DUF4365)